MIQTVVLKLQLVKTKNHRQNDRVERKKSATLLFAMMLLGYDSEWSFAYLRCLGFQIPALDVRSSESSDMGGLYEIGPLPLKVESLNAPPRLSGAAL